MAKLKFGKIDQTSRQKTAYIGSGSILFGVGVAGAVVAGASLSGAERILMVATGLLITLLGLRLTRSVTKNYLDALKSIISYIIFNPFSWF